MEFIFSDEIVGTSGAIRYPYPTFNNQHPHPLPAVEGRFHPQH